jgi:uncharacterized protein (DUF2147 family)
MKKIALMLAVVSGLATPAFAADPVEGIWKTKPDDNNNFGYVQIAPCGERFCGVLIKSFGSDGNEMQSPNVGKNIVWDMVAQGDGHYGSGKVWSPDRDKTYNSKMLLKGDVLDVSGCVLGGLICRASTWTRVQ